MVVDFCRDTMTLESVPHEHVEIIDDRCGVGMDARLWFHRPPGRTSMRSFNDIHGSQWQAAVLDASYGSMLLVFSHAGDSVVRKTAMSAENFRLAEQQLADMDESQLRSLLDASAPWE